MDLKIWVTYLITEFVLSITPGPAVLLITSQGVRYGAKTSYYGSVGISSANLFYFILSAFGLGTLILKAHNFFEILKWIGAVYLIYMGIKMIMNYSNEEEKEEFNKRVVFQSSGEAFFNAFVTQISNPKAIIFFVSLLPQFINVKGNIFYQFSLLALTTISLETLILMFYGWAGSKGSSSLKSNPKIKGWMDRIGGGILIGIGINLLFLKSKF